MVSITYNTYNNIVHYFILYVVEFNLFLINYSLGQQFATLEVITLVVMMLKEFKFELVPGQKSPPEFKDAITLPMKDPLMTKVSYRTKN